MNLGIRAILYSALFFKQCALILRFFYNFHVFLLFYTKYTAPVVE